MNQVNFYSRTCSNLDDGYLMYKNYELIFSKISTHTYQNMKFFNNLIRLKLSIVDAQSNDFNSNDVEQSIRPFFTTRFNNSFILGTYGFYFRVLPEEDTIPVTASLRTYLHSLYSFAESLSLKKNILKNFLLKKEYSIDSNAFEDFYDTFGFNFFMINNTLTHKKSSNFCNPLKIDKLNTIDSPFYNDGEEYEVEPDKSLRIKFKPGYSII